MPSRRLQAFRILVLLYFFLFFRDVCCMSSSSSSCKGDATVTVWSWILQYFSETDDDLLIENALFTTFILCFSILNLFDEELLTETDLFLLNFIIPNLPSLLVLLVSSFGDESFSFCRVVLICVFGSWLLKLRS